MSLADAQWARIEPLLPDRTPRGGRWRDHRQVIDAIAFKYRTGTPWTDLPEHFGSWEGVHNRLREWAADGTWEKVFTTLLAWADAEGDLDRVVAVDSTVVRAHQHAAAHLTQALLMTDAEAADRLTAAAAGDEVRSSGQQDDLAKLARACQAGVGVSESVDREGRIDGYP
ncbi:IS5 family transposase [Streptomyces sp. NPDC101150]|uniref:IS5 family transposase n=1 Tax=Streptomyces sp. NPDC101150 TaxID=3366114 RepID=UPI00380E1A5E